MAVPTRKYLAIKMGKEREWKNKNGKRERMKKLIYIKTPRRVICRLSDGSNNYFHQSLTSLCWTSLWQGVSPLNYFHQFEQNCKRPIIIVGSDTWKTGPEIIALFWPENVSGDMKHEVCFEQNITVCWWPTAKTVKYAKFDKIINNRRIKCH